MFGVLNVYTKFVKMYPVNRPTAIVVTDKLPRDYFTNVRTAKRIFSDNGTTFTLKLWNKVLDSQNI